MKNIAKYTLLAASVAMLFACQKSAPEKADVERGFTPAAAAPEVTIDLENYTFDNVAGTAVVSLTVSGITEGLDSLEVGFVVSTDSTMTNTNFFPVESTADGSYTQTVKITTGKVNYVQAVAAVLGNSSYSEILQFKVPDIEWYKKLPKTYYAHLTAYWDDEYDSLITVSYDPDTHQVTFSNFDPYLYSNKINTSYTVGLADIEDVENPTVNFEISEEGTFPLASTNGVVEYYSLIAVPFTDDFKNASSYKITFNTEMSEMTVQAWGLYKNTEEDGGWWEIYPTTTYKEQ